MSSVALKREVQIIINNDPVAGGEFSIDVAQIEVSSFSDEPDPNWTFIDAAGHYHAYTADLKLPTLITRDEWVAYEEPDEETGETGYMIRHLHCAICDEEVQPGRRSGPERKFIPGRMSWTVTVESSVARGDRATIRVKSGDVLWFGIATVVDVQMEMGRRPVAVFAGSGELGKRVPAGVKV